MSKKMHAKTCENEECENDDDSDLRGRDSIPTCEEDTKKAVMQEYTIRDVSQEEIRREEEEADEEE